MEFFGLDIGSQNIKIVQLKKGREGVYQLVSFGSTPSVGAGFLSESEKDIYSISEAIKKLHHDAGVKVKNVVTALPQDQVFVKTINFPQMSEEEIESALQWEAEQYVPIPLSEAILTHEIMGRIEKGGGEEGVSVLLAAAPKSLVEKVMKVLKIAGFNLLSIEMEVTSLVRSLVPLTDEVILLVDFGAKATDLAVVEKGKIILVHSIVTAGEALTRAISLGLDLEVSQAEAYKKSYGVDPEKLEGKIKIALEPILKIIIGEIKKTSQFCQGKGMDVRRVVLTGGGAALPSINSFLAKNLNLEVQVGDPFFSLAKNNILDKIPISERIFYSVAVGLAMKEI